MTMGESRTKYPGAAYLVWMCEQVMPHTYDGTIKTARYEGVSPEKFVTAEREAVDRLRDEELSSFLLPQVTHPDYLNYVEYRLAVN